MKASEKASAMTFEGDLQLLSLFDLGQLLRLNGASGRLSLRNGDRTGSLYFDGGQLVHAVDDRKAEGEEAAYALFAWQTGTFEFHSEAPPVLRLIESGSEAVMMEAARRLDEASKEGGSSATQRLRAHQSALEALRDVFKRVAGEARDVSRGVDALSTTAHLYQLAQPEDRLLYRPETPPFLRRRGRWAPVPEPPLTRADYEELCVRLMAACDRAPSGEEAARGRRMTLSDGRALSVERLGAGGRDDSMWIRLLGPAPQESMNVAGDLDVLGSLLSLSEGILILGAARIGTARQLLSTVVPLATGPADTLVMVSREPFVLPEVEEGLAFCVTPEELRGVLRAAPPEIVALDAALGPGDVALEDLSLVPRVLVGVVGDDPGAYAARWQLRTRGHEDASARAWLTAMLKGVVAARPTADDGGTLMVSAWPLDSEGRGLALRGELGGLAIPPFSSDRA